MTGDLFIRTDGDKNILLLSSSDRSAEIRLRLRHPGQHRGYFHLLMEERKGAFTVLLKEELIIPDPKASGEMVFRIIRRKRRRFLLEILWAGSVIYTGQTAPPPRKLQFLTAAGLIPLFFLALPLFTSQNPPAPSAAQTVAVPQPPVAGPSAPEPPVPPEPSPPREVVLADSPVQTVTREEPVPDTQGNLDGRDGPGGATESDRPEAAEASGATAPAEDKSATTPAAPEHQGVLFLPDSPKLTGRAKELLDRLPLREEEKTLTLLQVRGHCAPWGTEAGRQKLSVERAEAVARYLKDRGAMILPETVIEGLGATEPLTRDPANQEINRRVEIVLTYR